PARRPYWYNDILVIIVSVRLDILRYVLDLRRARESPPVQVFSKGLEAQRHIDHVLTQAAQAPRTARFVLYAANTNRDLFLRLRDLRCVVRILLQHPDSAANDIQRERIRGSINDLRDAVFNDYRDLELYAYRRP